MQTAYNNNFDAGQCGQIADAGNRRVESMANEDTNVINFGRGVAFGTDKENQVKNFYQKTCTLTLSADLAAQDSIAVSVNGDAITTVNYASSHAATFAALIAAINGLDNASAVAGTGRSIVITYTGGDADALVVAAVTHGGDGTAAASVAYSTTQSFAGVSVLYQNEAGEYAQYETVGIMTQGVIWGELVTGQTPAVGGSVYVVSKGDNRGKFTTVNDDTTEAVAGCVFKSAAATLNGKLCAKIEFNRP